MLHMIQKFGRLFFFNEDIKLRKIIPLFLVVVDLCCCVVGFLCLSEQVLPFLVLRLLTEVASFVAEHLL